MRVLHYVSSFSKLTLTFIYDLILELEEQGVENYIVTKERFNPKDRPFERVIVIGKPKKWNPEHVVRGFFETIKHGHHLASRWPMTRRKLVKTIKEVNPDVIHSHFGPPGVVMQPVALKFGLPHVVSFHGVDVFKNTRNPFWLDHYQKFKAPNAHLTCVSDYMADYLENILQGKEIKVVHVGKILADYPFKKTKDPIKNWLSIGRLVAKKGHEDTLRAFAEILKQWPQQHLTIIGEGENKETLKNLINTLGLKKSVTLFGAVSHEKTKKEMEKADAFILASKTAADGNKEGIPTVLMEAQAMGKPCVSTRHSGIPEVFPESAHSLLAEEGNPEDLAQKITGLLQLPLEQVQQLALAGRHKIEQEFNLTKEAKKLMIIYNAGKK